VAKRQSLAGPAGAKKKDQNAKKKRKRESLKDSNVDKYGRPLGLVSAPISKKNDRSNSSSSSFLSLDSFVGGNNKKNGGGNDGIISLVINDMGLSFDIMI
jgi:hypothetical protein